MIDGIDVLGVCAGMQIFAEESDEGIEQGLSWIKGKIRLFDSLRIEYKTKLPHMGWNQLKIVKNHEIMRSLSDNSEFYFMHSFGLVDDELPTNKKLYINFNDQEVLAMFHHQNLVGIQFHPERSGKPGVELLSSIVEKFKV